MLTTTTNQHFKLNVYQTFKNNQNEQLAHTPNPHQNFKLNVHQTSKLAMANRLNHHQNFKLNLLQTFKNNRPRRRIFQCREAEL